MRQRRTFSLAVLATVAVLVLTGCTNSLAPTGRWRHLPPPEPPIDRPFTTASDLCSLDAPTLIKLTGKALTPLPPITQPAGDTMCRWAAPDAQGRNADLYVQLDGMPSERIGDWGRGVLEQARRLPAHLVGDEATVKAVEAVVAALPELPTPWEGCDAADEISRILGGKQEGNAFVSYPPVVEPFLNGGTMVRVALCSNMYYSVLWVGSRTWTKANAPVQKLLEEQLYIHGRLSEL